MHMLKLTQIGNSVGVVLPKEALARLKLGKGESVFLTETPDGYALNCELTRVLEAFRGKPLPRVWSL